jgi:aerobic carbon-monoxide dehydrogenase medium subunit
MKAAAFDYQRAHSVDHALALLAEHGSDCKLIAGGQSLVPMMAMRLVRPAVLIDINRLAELQHLHISSDQVVMGAALRQRDVQHNAELQAALPLVRDALRWVGHVQTRNRGTVGGSLVHADPSAELPLAATMLGATLRLLSQKVGTSADTKGGTSAGKREVAAADFFLGPMFTAVGDTECLQEIVWPRWHGPGVVTAFEETAMRHGDFAMASAACQLQIDAAGVCTRAVMGVGGLDGTPLVFPQLAAQLVGQRISATLAHELAHAAVALTHPGSDLHADADYRRELGATLLARVLLRCGQPQAPQVTHLTHA